MKKISKYLLLMSLVALLAACTKEKKIERWLKKGVGEWQVTSFQSKHYQNGVLQSDGEIKYFGKYVFDEKGTFFMISYNDSAQTNVGYEAAGSWTNSKDVIYLNYKDGGVEEMKILEMKKDKMKLEYNSGYSEAEKYINTLSLEKTD